MFYCCLQCVFKKVLNTRPDPKIPVLWNFDPPTRPEDIFWPVGALIYMYIYILVFMPITTLQIDRVINGCFKKEKNSCVHIVFYNMSNQQIMSIKWHSWFPSWLRFFTVFPGRGVTPCCVRHLNCYNLIIGLQL